MPAWNDYSVKDTTPADTDTLMIKDNAATGTPNKRLLFSKLFDYVMSKTYAFTQGTKSIPAAINALDSGKADTSDVGDLTEAIGDLRDAVEDVKYELLQSKSKDKNIVTFTTWSKKRVNGDTGEIVSSPSQLTSDKVLYVGKFNTLKFTAESVNRSINITYFNKNDDGTFSYLFGENSVCTLRNLIYICMKHDYCRISFVGTAADPPLLSEFTVEVLHVRNNEFFGKNVSVLGDSISTFSGISESGYNAPYYPTGDISYYEQTYAKMFYDACGASNISVSAISASTWRNQSDVNKPSAYEDARITRLSINGTPDYVIINMGTNDPYSSNIGDGLDYTYDVTTLEAKVVYTSYAIQTTIRKIQVAYPNAKIIVLIPKFASAINTGAYTFEKWEKMVDFIKKSAEMYGCYKVVDLRKCGITTDNMSENCIASGMHPNFTGMKKMGMYLIDSLLLH